MIQQVDTSYTLSVCPTDVLDPPMSVDFDGVVLFVLLCATLLTLGKWWGEKRGYEMAKRDFYNEKGRRA